MPDQLVQPPTMDAATERRIADAFARRNASAEARERRANVVFAGGFGVAAATLLALVPPVASGWAVAALVLTIALGLAARVEFSVGAGYAVPTQLIFVPMLLLLPPSVVPGLVALAFAGSSAWEAARGRLPWSRAPLAVGDAWSSLAPALVVLALAPATPAWAAWPVYLLALGAQFASETVVCVVRGHASWGLAPREVLAELRQVFRVDALLAPVGMLVAIAAAPVPAGAVLVLPLVALLGVLAREREHRIAHSLELGRAYRGTAVLLRDLLEGDDEYTGLHTQGVVELSAAIAREMGLSEDVQRDTELGALLHDIGKIAIPDAIINKPGPLDDAEWAIMKTHTLEGQRMLDQVGGLLGSVGVIVRSSHERWDGGGYPDGLVGDAIPLPARLVIAADSFNAMTTDRSYRRAMPLDAAVAELRRCSGTQFDPAVVEAIIAVVTTPAWVATVGAAADVPAAPPALPV